MKRTFRVFWIRYFNYNIIVIFKLWFLFCCYSAVISSSAMPMDYTCRDKLVTKRVDINFVIKQQGLTASNEIQAKTLEFISI